MDKRKTPESILGNQIFLTAIEKAGQAFSIGYKFSDKKTAYNVARALRRHLTYGGWSGKIGTALRGQQLIVFGRQKSYTAKLEDMVSEMMLHVDDENIYERAMALLEKKQ